MCLKELTNVKTVQKMILYFSEIVRVSGKEVLPFLDRVGRMLFCESDFGQRPE